jgi:hypothetical protein
MEPFAGFEGLAFIAIVAIMVRWGSEGKSSSGAH